MHAPLIPPRYLCCSVITFCLMSGEPPASWAQTPVTGAVRGQVRVAGTPPPRGGIEGADVTFLNEETGSSSTTQTTRGGYYLISNLPPGRYTITASRNGYRGVKEHRLEKFLVRLSDHNPIKPPPLLLQPDRATQTTPVASPIPRPVLSASESEAGPFQFPAESDLSATPSEAGSSQASSTAQSSPGAEFEQLVNNVNATRSANFSGRELLALPLTGTRTFDDLAFLLPGVAPPPQTLSQTVGPGIGAGVGTSGQFAVNGLRSRANNFTVDGSDNNDEEIGVRRQGFTALLPQSIESLQEFYIATLLPPPQFGRNLGAQVNAVSRPGGSPGYHGTIYGYFTDRRLKAREFFDGERAPFGGEDEFTRGQFGFVLGGPVTKSRTRFFLSFEQQVIDARKESHFAVPTIAERGFRGSGEGVFKEPNLKAPTSAVGDAFLSLFPLPNNSAGPYDKNTFTESLSADARAAIASLRLDRQIKIFGRDHILTGRYNFADDRTELPVTGGALFSSLRALVRTHNLSLHANSTLSNRLMNELRFSVGRTRLNFQEIRDPFLLPSKLSGTALPALAGASGLVPGGPPFLLNALLIQNQTPAGGPVRLVKRPGLDSETGVVADGVSYGTGPLGQMIVSGFSPVGVDVFHFPQARANNTFQTADTIFYNLSKHRLVGGFDLRRIQLNSLLDRNFRSLAVFSGAPDLTPDLKRCRRPATQPGPQCFLTGADFAAIGAPSGFFQTQTLNPDSTIGLRQWQNNLFLADEIHIHHNFTVTIGARYELNTVPREVNRRIESSFTSPEVQSFVAKERELTGVSGLERFLAGRKTIYQQDSNNIAPHIALAWDPRGDGKTAVRAGYGIYYDQILGAVITQSRNVFPNFLTLNLAGLGLANFTFGGNLAFNAFNPARLAAQGTLNTLDAAGLKAAFGGRDLVESLLGLEQLTNFAGGPGFILPAANLETPYAQHWGLTVEREVKSDFLVSLAYVGTKGSHLFRFATPNLGPNALPVILNIQSDMPPPGQPEDQLRFFFFGRTLSPVFQGKPLRRFPLLGSFTSIESDVNSIYHSLQAQLNRRFSRGIQFTTAYTWSHAIDEVSDLFDLASGPSLPQNSFNPDERGNAGFDIRHRFVTSFIWNLLPSAKGKLLGGWQLAGIGAFQTGQPFTIQACCDVNLDGNLTDRLDTTMGINETNQGRVRFTAPKEPEDQLGLLAELMKDGAVGRNTYRAPGIARIDLAISKHFEFDKQRRLEVRAEFFNFFNRTHFGMPVHQLLFPSLGQSVDTRSPALTVQFAVRYSF